MQIRRISVAGIAFSILIVLPASAEADVPPLPALEDAVLKYRRAIIRGHVRVKSRHERPAPGGPPLSPVERERETECWFDKQRLRNDLWIRYDIEKPPHREVYCSNCEGPDGSKEYSIYYSEQEQPPGTRLAISMDEMRGTWNVPMLAPNMIGMALEDTPNLARYNLESFVRRGDRKDVAIERTSHEGAEVFQISYTGVDGDAVRILVAPEKGPSAVAFESRFVTGKWEYVDSVQLKLEKITPAGLWFPVRSEYERRLNGEMTDREVAEIEVLSLNEPLPSDTFRLAGMNLPDDTPVTPLKDPEIRGPLAWDGGKLAPMKTSREQTPPPPTREGIRTILIVNAIALAALAVMITLRHLRGHVPRNRPPPA